MASFVNMSTLSTAGVVRFGLVAVAVVAVVVVLLVVDHLDVDLHTRNVVAAEKVSFTHLHR